MSNNQFDLDLLLYKKHIGFRKVDDKQFLFDPIRKKNIILQPEELVRQLFILHLIKSNNISPNRIAIEKEIKIDGLRRRFDILTYHKDMSPQILVECKSFSIELDQSIFDQLAQYNQVIRAKYLIITNGKSAICAEMDYKKNDYHFLKQIPIKF